MTQTFFFLTYSIYFLVASFTSNAQPDSVVDVFPLAIGNEWNYRYSKSVSGGGLTDSYFGTAQYTIIDKTEFADSIVWLLQERRTLIHCMYRYFGGDTCYPPQSDSNTFVITEFLQEGHPLFRQDNLSSIGLSVFPFGRDVVDSGIVYRYRNVGLGDSIVFHSRDIPDSTGQYESDIDYTFKKNVGEIRVHCQNSEYIVGVFYYSNHYLVDYIINGVHSTNENLHAQSFSLSQNYPNPFNPTTNFRFQISDLGFVSLKIYNTFGSEIATLVNETLPAGNYEREWNAEKFPSGMYFYRLTSGRFSETKKLLLLK